MLHDDLVPAREPPGSFGPGMVPHKRDYHVVKKIMIYLKSSATQRYFGAEPPGLNRNSVQAARGTSTMVYGENGRLAKTGTG